MYVIELMCLFGVSDDDDADDVTGASARGGKNQSANQERKVWREGGGKRDLDYTSRVRRRTKKDTRVT